MNSPLAGDVELAASLLPAEDSFMGVMCGAKPVVALLPTDHALARGDGVSLQDIASLPFSSSRAALLVFKLHYP